MRYCPQCGAPLMAGAKFCVECGRAIDGGAASAGSSGGSANPLSQTLRNQPLTFAFIAVFLGITIVGLAAAGWIMLRTPPVVHPVVASAPQASLSGGATASNSMEGTAGNSAPGQLPPGHPTVQLPTEARTFIDQVEKEAQAKPKDIGAWNKYGTVTMRAAMFDSSYYSKATEAYAHVLKLDPDNLTALRGIGDIDYDNNKYDEAIAAYEHYLKKKPEDPEVRTDLGTMYLYTGNADQAVIQYKRALSYKPDMFQAYFNLGVAYAQEDKVKDATEALTRARKLAPDANARAQVEGLLAKITGVPPPAMASSQAPPAAATPPAPAATTFHGQIEQVVRTMPVAGTKVGAVQWPGQLKATVTMNDFPMDKMPPFAKQRFLSDLKSGIASAKKNFKVSGKVEVDLVDGGSGRVMESVTE
jgi:tetratricopeptide (TPR) repeat protein